MLAWTIVLAVSWDKYRLILAIPQMRKNAILQVILTRSLKSKYWSNPTSRFPASPIWMWLRVWRGRYLELTTKSSVLFWFSLSLLQSIQSPISLTHSSTVSFALDVWLGQLDVNERYFCVSSAYRWNGMRCFLGISPNGLVESECSKGPNTDPCGTLCREEKSDVT